MTKKELMHQTYKFMCLPKRRDLLRIYLRITIQEQCGPVVAKKKLNSSTRIFLGRQTDNEKTKI